MLFYVFHHSLSGLLENRLRMLVVRRGYMNAVAWSTDIGDGEGGIFVFYALGLLQGFLDDLHSIGSGRRDVHIAADINRWYLDVIPGEAL
jgi:hypothetical protein